MAVHRPTRPAQIVPDVAPLGQRAGMLTFPQCVFGTTIVNALPVDVTIVTRTGLEFFVPKLPGRNINRLVIQSYAGSGRNVILDTTRLLNDRDKYKVKGAVELANAMFTDGDFPGAPNNMPSRGVMNNGGSVVYELSKQDFDRNGGVIYLENLDLMVATLHPSLVPRHPYSLGARADDILESDPVLHDRSGMHYRIQIIDSANKFGNRYANLNGQVYAIYAVTDSDYPDGVYLTRTIPNGGSGEFQLPESVAYDFETADKELGLYKTPQEAESLGKPENLLKREWEQRKHDFAVYELEQKRKLQERESELADERRNWDRERDIVRRDQEHRDAMLRQRDQELAIAERNVKIQSAENQRLGLIRDDYYEQRSIQRKERLEVLKSIPVLLTATGALAALAIKIWNSSKT